MICPTCNQEIGKDIQEVVKENEKLMSLARFLIKLEYRLNPIGISLPMEREKLHAEIGVALTEAGEFERLT